MFSQIDDDGIEKVVAFASPTLSTRERNFSATEKEVYAIVFCTRHFRVYLLGRKFKIVTDHKALKFLHTMEPKGRIARWIMDLQEFQFEVEHRPGKQNTNTDSLSRLDVQANATAQTHTQGQTDSNTLKQSESAQIVSKYLAIGAYIFKLISRPHSSQLDTTNTPLSNAATSGAQVASDHTCAVTLNPSVDLKEAQRQDKTIATVIEFKSNGKHRPQFSDWASDPSLRQFWYNYNRLFMRNNLLMRVIRKDESIPRYAVVVPQCLVKDILHGVHHSPYAGHLGVTKTIDRLRQILLATHAQVRRGLYQKMFSVCAVQRSRPCKQSPSTDRHS